MQIESFLSAIDNRITCGGKWHWHVFGEYAYELAKEDSDTGSSCVCVFDTRTKQVYELQAWDETKNKRYRWIDPSYIELYKEECITRKIDYYVDWIDIDVEIDMLEKLTAIAAGKEYDERIRVNLNFESDEELLKLLLMAHEDDLTFNAFVEKTIQAVIDEGYE